MPPPIHQFFVRADFADAAALQHHDLVGAANGGKPVRDHDHRAVRHQVRQRPLHQHFGFGIQVRRGFVQNQDRRILQQRAGDGHAAAAGRRSSFTPRSPIMVS